MNTIMLFLVNNQWDEQGSNIFLELTMESYDFTHFSASDASNGISNLLLHFWLSAILAENLWKNHCWWVFLVWGEVNSVKLLYKREFTSANIYVVFDVPHSCGAHQSSTLRYTGNNVLWMVWIKVGLSGAELHAVQEHSVSYSAVQIGGGLWNSVWG